MKAIFVWLEGMDEPYYEEVGEVCLDDGEGFPEPHIEVKCPYVKGVEGLEEALKAVRAKRKNKGFGKFIKEDN